MKQKGKGSKKLRKRGCNALSKIMLQIIYEQMSSIIAL